MKLKLCCFSIVWLVVCLCACNIHDSNKSDEKTTEGSLIISDEDFSNYITQIELTTGNWKEYFDVYEGKDGVYGLYAKNHKNTVTQFLGRSATMEMKDLKTDEIYVLKVSEALVLETDESYTLSDFECVSIDGTILMATVPEKFWQNVDAEQLLWQMEGDRVSVIYVGNEDEYTWYSQEFGVGNNLQDYFYQEKLIYEE